MSKEPEDNNEEKSLSHYIGLGVALGAGIGTALGSFFPMGIGVVIGSVLHEQNKNNE